MIEAVGDQRNLAEETVILVKDGWKKHGGGALIEPGAIATLIAYDPEASCKASEPVTERQCYKSGDVASVCRVVHTSAEDGGTRPFFVKRGNFLPPQTVTAIEYRVCEVDIDGIWREFPLRQPTFDESSDFAYAQLPSVEQSESVEPVIVSLAVRPRL